MTGRSRNEPDSWIPIDHVLARQWFYEFDLPGGRKTRSYLPAGVEKIHTTRLEMLLSALEPIVSVASRQKWSDMNSAISCAPIHERCMTAESVP